MAKNTSLTLGDHFDGFIASQVQSGRYGSASEIIRSALRLLGTQETKIDILRQSLLAAEKSDVTYYELDDFISKLATCWLNLRESRNSQ